MQGFIDKKYLTEHPHGQIRLLNGRLLEDYYVTHNLTNDYEWGNMYNAPKSTYDLFIDNAQLLFRHRGVILHDSRMFLAPLHTTNMLAYVGGMGFQRPILGAYIEWWCVCPYSRIEERDGTYSLVYQLSGSPLSGSNNCKMVDSKGVRKNISLVSFASAWRPFVGINTRYEPCKNHYVYSLEEVIEILKKGEK